ncbi:MAG: AAA family ATPase [Pseudomonadota bacterium]
MFSSVQRGDKAAVFVCGPPGSGKTAVVGEVFKTLSNRNGFFIIGKFDPLRRHVPFSGLAEAFRDLCRQVLTETEAGLALWRDRLGFALSSLGGVIIELIPELELIIGPQPAVPDLGPTETQNRLRFAFQNFIKVFCREEKPLAIFLDDLQWADPFTLSLTEMILTHDELSHLLLIGAYRDNEIAPGHPLGEWLQELEGRDLAATRLTLPGLTLEDVIDLTSDSLRRSGDAVFSLAGLAFRRTGGNPFFLTEFLKSVFTAGLLWFDPASQAWAWNLSRIQELGITENVVEFLAEKIAKLPPEGLQALTEASFFGDRFALEELSLALDRPAGKTVARLGPALEEGLIIPQSDEEYGDEKEPWAASFKFSHDRIQQAAYSLVPVNEIPSRRLRLGRLLAGRLKPDSPAGKIFEAVAQYNLGRDLIETKAERIALARLNMRAGKRAATAAAHDSAWTFLQTALDLFGEDLFDADYPLWLDSRLRGAEAAFLSGHEDKMERLTGEVIRKSSRVLDQAKAFEVRIQAYVAANRLGPAEAEARAGLGLLGVRFPVNPGRAHVLAAYLKTRALLWGRGMEDLRSLPPMSEPKKLAAMALLYRALPAVYSSVPELLPLVIFKMATLTVGYGRAENSAIAFAGYGAMLCGLIGDIDQGYRFGLLAVQALKASGNDRLQASITFLFNCFIRHWKEHYREISESSRAAYLKGLETGDLEYSGYSAFEYCANAYEMGSDLPRLNEEMEFYHDALARNNLQTQLFMLKTFWQVVRNLMGLAENPTVLTGLAYDEGTLLPRHLESRDLTTAGLALIHKLTLCYLFHDLDGARAAADRAEKCLISLVGTQITVLFFFFDGLSQLAACRDRPPGKRRKSLRRAARDQRKIKKWARFAPMNFLHKFHLMEAERLRTLNQGPRAMVRYDLAISGARENGFTADQALANELAGKFFLETGREDLGRAFLLNSRSVYQKWGAGAKVKDLDEHFGRLILGGNAGPTDGEEAAFLLSRGAFTLDWGLVMKASQAISEELAMEKLVGRLLDIFMESAGAGKGGLVLDRAGRLVVVALFSLGTNERSFQARPLESCPDLCQAAVQYAARTRETLVIGDALKEKLFSTDPYVQKYRPRSMLCLPLNRRGRLLGLLYLDNSLAPGSFVPERLQVLNILCTQAAISLDNAALYSNLEKQAEQLGQAEKLKRLVLENAHEAALMIQDDSIRFANSKFSDLLGFPLEQSTLSPARFLHPRDRRETLEYYTRHLRGEYAPARKTFRVINAKGQEKCVEANTTLVEWEGKPALLSFLNDITEKARAEQALLTYQERLRNMGTEILLAEERERRRIASDLHDQIGQSLSGCLIKLKTVRDDIADDRAVREIEGLCSLLQDMITEVRSLVFDLSPPVLYILGLGPALAWLTEKIQEGYGLKTEFQESESTGALNDKLKGFLYRAVRELLMNVVKHAEAGQAWVRASTSEGFMQLEVEDDGKGFPAGFDREADLVSDGFGLFSLKERIQTMGGRMTIVSPPGKGAVVALTVPLLEK